MTVPVPSDTVHYKSVNPNSQAAGFADIGGVNYAVTPEYLAQARSDTIKTAQSIEQKLADLKAYVQQMEDTWGGVAYKTFVTLMQDYDTYARMLHDALTDIASGLQGTYINYVQSEEQNINNLRALGEDLPKPPTGTNFD
jgi:WXG100 family type VII secretion target